MIRNQWYVVLESKEVKKGKLLGVTRMGEKLVFWRDNQGKVVCMLDRCAHRGVALSAGKIMPGCQTVQCPFHGFEYDSSGACTYIPANGRNARPPDVVRVNTYPTYEDRGWVWIWWGEGDPQPAAPPYFDSIPVSYPHATFKDHWKTHYSRAIENQLDAFHLPFVHYNTIGRGDRRIADGPIVEWCCSEEEPYRMDLWVSNRVDDGIPPKKPSEIGKRRPQPSLQFLFPNLWQNWISDEIRLVVAFVPVDDENTVMYLRSYQNITRLPILRQLFDLSFMLGSLIIERQDRRVVITQRPMRSRLRGGEKLVQADGPIIDYRRRREELLHRTGQD